MAKTKKQENIVDENFIAELEDILRTPCDVGGTCPGNVCADYDICTRIEKMPDFDALERQAAPQDIGGDGLHSFPIVQRTVACDGALFDARRKILSDYCDALCARAGGTYSIDICTGWGASIVATVRGAAVTGFRRKLVLSISTNEYDSDRVMVEGVPTKADRSDTWRNYLAIGNCCITAVSNGLGGFSAVKLPVSEHLVGAYLCLTSTGGTVLSTEDAQALYKIFDYGTRITAEHDYFIPVRYIKPERTKKESNT